MKGWTKRDIEKMKGKAISKLPKKEPKAVAYIRITLQIMGLKFEEEYKFSSDRKFRFDFAIRELKIGIEYEGVNSAKSRHTSITGYTRDAEKYNLAQVEGWRVLRYTVLNYEDVERDLKLMLNKTNNHE